jgi:hypothetical protein
MRRRSSSGGAGFKRQMPPASRGEIVILEPGVQALKRGLRRKEDNKQIIHVSPWIK